MAHQFVFGLIGPVCTANARKTWNELLRKEGVDGFFDFYRAMNQEDLVTRLSEMFLLERRGYIIAPSLQEASVPLMDFLAPSARAKRRVDMVKNERGVFTGHCVGGLDPREILQIWMAETVSH